MQLLDAMRTTPACRDFTDAPVDDATVARLVEAARFAPSGGNRQPWRVISVRDPATRAEVQRLYQLSWREYVAHVGHGLVPFAPIDDGHWTGPAVDLDAARSTPAPNPFADGLANVPALLLICVELRGLAVLDNGLDRQSIVGGGSVYPFCHNLLLAARDHGLGGVMTTVLCRQEPAVAQLVGLPTGWALAGMLALGVPVKQLTKLRRKPVEDLLVIDTFDGPGIPVVSSAPAD